MIETEEAVAAYDEHGSTRAAAKALGVTRGSISYHLKKAGRVTPNKTIDRDRVVRLYREGYSMSEVGRALDCSPHSVSRICNDRGVEIREGGRSSCLELPVDQIIADWLDGASVTELAEKHDCTRTTIQKRIADHA